MKLASMKQYVSSTSGRAAKTRTGAAVRLGGAAAGEVLAIGGLAVGLTATLCGAAVALVGYGIHEIGIAVSERSEDAGLKMAVAKGKAREDYAAAATEVKARKQVNAKRRAAYKLQKLKERYEREHLAAFGDGAIDVELQPA